MPLYCVISFSARESLLRRARLARRHLYSKLPKLSLESFRRIESMKKRAVLSLVRDDAALVQTDNHNSISCRLNMKFTRFDTLAKHLGQAWIETNITEYEPAGAIANLLPSPRAH
jgi:hypothetical protein